MQEPCATGLNGAGTASPARARRRCGRGAERRSFAWSAAVNPPRDDDPLPQEDDTVDLLDRLLAHDAWTTRQLLGCAGELPDDELDVEFEIGLRTLRATFDHVVFNMEVWSGLMAGDPVQIEKGSRPDERTIVALLERLDRAASKLAGVARAVADRHAWDERWLDVLDDPNTEKTYGGAIAHVLTHSMHHRAQVLYMLRRLGVQSLPEGDVLTWEQQAATA
jgi:uncharacterized damage-inducible protein DinB